MDEVELEITLLQNEIEKANAAIGKALSDRRALHAAVVAAQQALIAVEIQLRQLYENKD